MVFTVRSVATFFRAPWCSSIVIVFLDGWEKQTERCDMSLTSLPAMRKTMFPFSSYHLHGVPRGPSTLTILDLMCTLTISLLALRFCLSQNVRSATLVSEGSAKLGRLPMLCGQDDIKIALPLAGMISVSCECMYLILFDG